MGKDFNEMSERDIDELDEQGFGELVAKIERDGFVIPREPRRLPGSLKLAAAILLVAIFGIAVAAILTACTRY